MRALPVQRERRPLLTDVVDEALQCAHLERRGPSWQSMNLPCAAGDSGIGQARYLQRRRCSQAVSRPTVRPTDGCSAASLVARRLNS
jgi:hypothetical protein